MTTNDDMELDDWLAYNPFDYVEPCEPDCSPERHAYHQGQWDMACRICEYYGVFTNPVDGDKIRVIAQAWAAKQAVEARIDELKRLHLGKETWLPILKKQVADRLESLQQGEKP